MNGFAPGKHAQENYDRDLVVRADVAVVGAGAGGCAVAAALAEAGLNVAVVEEGRHWKPSQFKPDTVWAMRNLYQERGMRSLRGNAFLPLPGGRGVGGSTLVNSAICFRTPPDILDLWRNEYGCELVTRERFTGYFDRIWKTLGVTVNPVAVQRNNNLIFRQGAEALGLKGAFMERSAPNCVGCGICQYGCPSGGKSSADRTFLAEAVSRGTVGVYADCRISRAVTAGDRVIAVEGDVLHGTGQHVVGTVRVEADTFVLAGGPIGSPLFLLANGLATHEHCGAHLVVHPATSLMARFEQEIVPWRGVTQGYFVDCWDRGFLLQTYTLTPDQYYLIFQSPNAREMVERLADLRHIASAGALIHDQDGDGRVQWTPAGPDLRYHLGDGDRRRLIDGMRLGTEVFFAAGALEVYPGAAGVKPIRPGDDVAAALNYDISAPRLVLYASHPMGTCRMGGDPATSVVDPHGRVWGFPNLRVADASVFPTSLGVNPQVTTMAFGLLVGQSIAGVA